MLVKVIKRAFSVIPGLIEAPFNNFYLGNFVLASADTDPPFRRAEFLIVSIKYSGMPFIVSLKLNIRAFLN